MKNARFDLLLRNARIFDGAGGPWSRADLAVEGDTISAVLDAGRSFGYRADRAPAAVLLTEAAARRSALGLGDCPH